MADSISFKRPLLYLLVVSVVLGAILGIGIVLLNTWGWYEIRVIFTTVIIAVASLCGLACDLSKLPVGPNLLPKSGLCLTAISAALLLVGLWGDLDVEIYWKTAVCFLIVGFATVHVCLLSIAKLVARFRWVYIIGSQVIFGLASLLCGIVIFEIDSEEIFRTVAAISILVAAITLIIPVLHRLGKISSTKEELLMPIEARNIAVIDEQISQLERRISTLKHFRAQIIDVDTTKEP